MAHTQSTPQFEDRVRFNWGFWNGRADSRCKIPNHFDKVYDAGVDAGILSQAQTVCHSSDHAWKDYKSAIKAKREARRIANAAWDTKGTRY